MCVWIDMCIHSFYLFTHTHTHNTVIVYPDLIVNDVHVVNTNFASYTYSLTSFSFDFVYIFLSVCKLYKQSLAPLSMQSHACGVTGVSV
jgi:hypothetical protein